MYIISRYLQQFCVKIYVSIYILIIILLIPIVTYPKKLGRWISLICYLYGEDGCNAQIAGAASLSSS